MSNEIYLFTWPVYEVEDEQLREIQDLTEALLGRYSAETPIAEEIGADQLARVRYDIADAFNRNRRGWLRNLYRLREQGIDWLRENWRREVRMEGSRIHLQEIIDYDLAQGFDLFEPDPDARQEQIRFHALGRINNAEARRHVSMIYTWDMHPPTPPDFRREVICMLRGERTENLPAVTPLGSFEHEAAIRDGWAAAVIEAQLRRQAQKQAQLAAQPKKLGFLGRLIAKWNSLVLLLGLSAMLAGCTTVVDADGQKRQVLSPGGAAVVQTIVSTGVGAATGALMPKAPSWAVGAASGGAGSVAGQAVNYFVPQEASRRQYQPPPQQPVYGQNQPQFAQKKP